MRNKFICWTRIGKVFSFKYLRIITTSLLVVCCIVWFTGLSEFLFETSFDKFKWPPFIDVRSQVVRQLTGKSAEHPYYNNWNNFQPVITPSCKNNRFTRRRFLLIIVKTSPYRIEYRDAIRSTYGALQEVNSFRLHTIFSMGLPIKPEEKVALLNESNFYGDLLVGNFIDHYFNNTYKFLNSIDLARSFCGVEKTVPYLFLMDDDYLISPRNLVMEALRHAPNERLYLGWRIVTSPLRSIFDKHKISTQEYPFNAYPPYITGGAVLLTSQTIKEFYLAIQFMHLFRFDDVFFGIIAYLLGISAIHNDKFSFYRLYKFGEEENVMWRSLIAMHDFKPKEIYEKYKLLSDVLI